VIRKAAVNDIGEIWKIHQGSVLDVSRVSDKEYCAEVQANGFIVSGIKEADEQERIEKSSIFDVFEEGGEVIGFVDVNNEIYFPEDADNTVWLTPGLKHSYFHGQDSTVLHHIGTVLSARRRGIARELFENSLPTLKDRGYKHLFSIVTTGPVTNCPSIVWHTKMGFERACTTTPVDIFGLKDYTSLLFHISL